MKSSRLKSTTESHTRAAVVRARLAATQETRRVETPEGIEGDRQRSLQQELTDENLPSRSSGDAREEARHVAEQLLDARDHLADLVKTPTLPAGFSIVDERI
nr:hypothetical protein [Dechloromonas sp.]